MFARSVENHPDAPALSYVGENEISYSELKLRIDSLSAYLERLGIRPGDKVAILGNNMPNWYS